MVAEPGLTLTPTEQALIEHVAAGEVLDLAGADPIDEAAMRTWGSERYVRARVIRDILRGRLAPDPDPHGLRLRGAVISGRIDLEDLTTAVNLDLEACLLDEGLCASGAHLSDLMLTACCVTHPTEPAVDAAGLVARGVGLAESVITANTERGAVTLSYAKLLGLVCSGARITNPAGPALVAGHLQADDVGLDDGFEASGTGTAGAVSLYGVQITSRLSCSSARLANVSGPGLKADNARIGHEAWFDAFEGQGAGELGVMRLSGAKIGSLICFGARLINRTGPALVAEAMNVEGHAHLTEGFFAKGSGEIGTLRLINARIGGELLCSGARLVNDSGPALYADGIHVATVARFDDGFKATGSGKRGTVRLPVADIVGDLICCGARLANDSGPALIADRLQVGGDVWLNQEFHASGRGDQGALQLFGARIGGQLNASRARLRNKTGPALSGDYLQVMNDLKLERTRASGSGGKGAVHLNGARIGGQLICARTALRNKSGPALRAEMANIEQGFRLLDDFTAYGDGELGAICLVGARVGGQVDCSGASLRNHSGPALMAQDLHVGLLLLLAGTGASTGFRATGGGHGVVLDLTNASVDGPLIYDPSLITNVRNPDLFLRLEGLTYIGPPQRTDVQEWLSLLREATPAYAAQPYQHFATVHRASGHDREVRTILMAQRRDQLDRVVTSRSERTWGRVTGLTLGYGYQPWRALIGLLGTVASAIVLSLILGMHGALAHVSGTAASSGSCSSLDQVGFGLNVSLPLVKVATGTCAVTNTIAGQALTTAGWLLQVLAWAFTTLFVAGFTSAVRKT
ncbi:hypothetical protein ACFYZJ_32335 [Streptomyces sp. NPDC001848]|uniref:hypothetical protein n=1 Tax=Streptomyces sp. NPDC001848 TaxID=3364618 RepID=UPI003673E67F